MPESYSERGPVDPTTLTFPGASSRPAAGANIPWVQIPRGPFTFSKGAAAGTSRAGLSPPLLPRVSPTSQATRLPERRPTPPQSRLCPLAEFLRPTAQPPRQPISASSARPRAPPHEELRAPANNREGRGGGVSQPHAAREGPRGTQAGPAPEAGGANRACACPAGRAAGRGLRAKERL